MSEKPKNKLKTSELRRYTRALPIGKNIVCCADLGICKPIFKLSTNRLAMDLPVISLKPLILLDFFCYSSRSVGPIYDFARNSWDDNKKTMAGKPMKMHTDHAFANEHWRRWDYVNKFLRSKPEGIHAADDYSIVRYSSIAEMPFDMDRMDFFGRGVYNRK